MVMDILFGDNTWKTILVGLLATIRISFFSVLLGTILGMGICWLRMQKNRLLSALAATYIAVLRGSPVLMFLMLMYYVVFAGSVFSAYQVAIITFSLNVAAYIAEILRTSIGATERGQVEAARTLGFSGRQAFFYVTLPQAVKIAKPLYESTIINLIQWTSVVGYVTITDLTKVINNVSARTMQPVIMFVVGMLLYIGMAYFVRLIFMLTERGERHG